jgi:hypothetical protein
MSTKIFEVPLINPIRLVELTNLDPRYQTIPFDLFSDDKCYFQKFQTNDTTKIQFLADYDSRFYVRDLHTNALIDTITPTDTGKNFPDFTFKCYEVELDFSNYGEGDYYCELDYSDDTSAYHVYQSEPINVADDQPGTILLECTNSENNFGIVFEDNFIIVMRVEGGIHLYTPSRDDVIYNDQLKNTTKLNAVSYRKFTLFIGNAEGIPNWIGDKVNMLFDCDQIKIDGEYYQNIEGSEWEVVRAEPDGTPFIGQRIVIMPVLNVFLQKLITGDTPEGFTVVEKAKNYFDQAADFAVVDVFRKYSLLKNLTIFGNDFAFTLNIGTTPLGTEIGTFDIPVGKHNYNIGFPFDAATIVYLSGITGAGTVTDFCFDYLQYDEDPAGGIPGATPPTFPPGFVGMYEEVSGRPLVTDWNVGTGLGQSGSPYEGCVICDGRNDSADRGGTVAIGYIDGDPIYGLAQLNNIIGADSIRQTKAQMAPHGHAVRTTNSPPSGSGAADPVRGNGPGTAANPQGLESNGIINDKTIQITGGNADATGLGAPMSIIQRSMVTLFFKRISA